MDTLLRTLAFFLLVSFSIAQNDCVFKAGEGVQLRTYTFADTLSDEIFVGEVNVGDPQELGYKAEIRISFCNNLQDTDDPKSCVADDSTRFNNTMASIEQFDTDSEFCDGYLASWDEQNIVFNYLDPENRDVGVFMSFTNGQVTGCQGEVQTTINIHCSDAINEPPFTYMSTVEDPSVGLCNYVIEFHSPDGCFGSENVIPGSGTSNKLSGGWVFVIILVVAILVYLVVGVLYKSMQMGTSGVESIPNIDFWRQIPQLVREGCSYTRACFCGGQSGSYDDVAETRGGGYNSAGGAEAYNPISSSQTSRQNF